jgi:hypothetical protein
MKQSSSSQATGKHLATSQNPPTPKPSSSPAESSELRGGSFVEWRKLGTLTVIHQDSPDQYHVIENVPTPQGSRNMGLDPANHRVFVVSAKFGPVPAGGRGRGPVLPGSFTLMVIERDSAMR